MFGRLLASALALVITEPCLAASGGFQYKAASFLAWFIIIVMPIGGIVLFWLVHVLPEKIAEKRQHPQKDAIHVLCLLSLVFGGLLWPLAWLWAYTRPVLHKMAYGRDKHDDHYLEIAAKEASGEQLTLPEELARLRRDLEALEKRGELAGGTQAISDRLARLESHAAQAPRTSEGAR
jgi:CBS domain containing-hemolysin-like protein